MGQRAWIREEDRATFLIDDGSIAAREEGCSVDVDRQTPGVMRTAHNAGGICVGSIHLGVHLKIVGVLCF
jgi:hypothetical protein